MRSIGSIRMSPAPLADNGIGEIAASGPRTRGSRYCQHVHFQPPRPRKVAGKFASIGSWLACMIKCAGSGRDLNEANSAALSAAASSCTAAVFQPRIQMHRRSPSGAGSSLCRAPYRPAADADALPKDAPRPRRADRTIRIPVPPAPPIPSRPCRQAGPTWFPPRCGEWYLEPSSARSSWAIMQIHSYFMATFIRLYFATTPILSRFFGFYDADYYISTESFKGSGTWISASATAPRCAATQGFPLSRWRGRRAID